MEETNLVVGGFSQPSVARGLIEFPGNTEKGFSQRFLWIFSRPSYAHFETLQPVNREFTQQISKFNCLKVHISVYVAICPFSKLYIDTMGYWLARVPEFFFLT